MIESVPFVMSLCFCVFATLIANTFIFINELFVVLNVTGMPSPMTHATKVYVLS